MILMVLTKKKTNNNNQFKIRQLISKIIKYKCKFLKSFTNKKTIKKNFSDIKKQINVLRKTSKLGQFNNLFVSALNL